MSSLLPMPRIFSRFYNDAIDFRATFLTVVRLPTPPPILCAAVAGASPSTSMTRPHLPTSYICTTLVQTPRSRRSTQLYSLSPATPCSHPRCAASHFTTPVGPSRTSSSTHASHIYLSTCAPSSSASPSLPPCPSDYVSSTSGASHFPWAACDHSGYTARVLSSSLMWRAHVLHLRAWRQMTTTRARSLFCNRVCDPSCRRRQSTIAALR